MRLSSPAATIPPYVPQPASKPPPNPQYSKLSEDILVAKDVINLVGGDLPTLASIAANVLPLPKSIENVVHGSSGPNVLFFGMGFVGTGIDLHRLVKVYKDPKSTPHEKHMELSHLILADIIPTATSVLPMLNMYGTLAQVAFISTQLVGIGSDGWKTVYDIEQRKKHQGIAVAPPPAPGS